MTELPKSIVDQILLHCEINGIAMASVGSKNGAVFMLLFGERELTPDEASIIAAHMLLTGVLSRKFAEDNQKRAEDGLILKQSLN